VQCVARNAADWQATRGAVLTITDHQRQSKPAMPKTSGNCVRYLIDELGHTPVRWPPNPGDPVAWWTG
jgi:hypothetical protein